MKKGGQLELAIELIQRTLINTPDTKVYRNHKIPSKSGRKREIDILVVSQVNGFEIQIAIACKDYTRKVSAEKIEAFNSKCELLKSINKKVFVSSNGYQPSAIDSAKEFGIELLTAPKINQQDILKWLGISVHSLGFEFVMPFQELVLYLASDDEDYIQKTTASFDGHTYWRGSKDSVHIANFLVDFVNKNKLQIFNLGLLEWLRKKDNEKFIPFPFPIKIEFKGLFIIGFDGNRIEVNGLSASIPIRYTKKNADISSARVLADESGSIKANSFSFKAGQGLTTNVVSKEGRSDIYLSDEKDQSVKLKTLIMYDPKSDSYSFPED